MIDKIALAENDYQLLINGSGNKFNSTLLEIFNDRANKVKPSNLLKNYTTKHSLYEISKIDPRIYNILSNIFFESVSKDFECIELSPIIPFGLNASLTNTNQNNVLSAVRNSEVISDSSISMSLECASRIRNLKIDNINLASSTRLLRTQNYGNGKKNHWSQHFRACSLISSFRNVNNNMLDTLILQIGNWLKVLENMREDLGIKDINVNLCYIPLVIEICKAHGVDIIEVLKNSVNPDFDIFMKYGIDLSYVVRSLDDINSFDLSNDYLKSIVNVYSFFNNNVIKKLKNEYQNVNYNLQLNRKSGLTYYEDICYEVEVAFEDGKTLTLIDGGITNWIGKILSDSKEKCVTSGMGLEYIGKVYKKKYEYTNNRR